MSIEQTDQTLFDASELTVSMGPQHPSTHGVLQVKLKLDGERVIDAECVIGYLHRGVEKLGEAQTYGQFVPTLDRMDYIAAVSNCLGLLRDDREASRHHRPAARAVHPRDHDGVEPHQQPPALARHPRARYRRHDRLPLRVPRARRDPEDFRKLLRRPAHDAHVPHRRHAVRDLRGFPGPGSRLHQGLSEEGRTSTKRC